MNATLVQQPDDELCIAVNEYNPYKEVPSDTNSDKEVYFGDTLVFLNPQNAENARRLDRFSRIITAVCMLDFCIAWVNFILTGFPYFLLVCLFDLFGYWGVVYFNKTYLTFYMIYQFFAAMGTVVWVCIFVHTLQIGLFCIMSVNTILHLTMFNIVNKFIKMFPN